SAFASIPFCRTLCCKVRRSGIRRGATRAPRRTASSLRNSRSTTASARRCWSTFFRTTSPRPPLFWPPRKRPRQPVAWSPWTAECPPRTRDKDKIQERKNMSDAIYHGFEVCQKDRGIDLKAVKAAIKDLKVETPSWGYGDSGTRFKVFKKAGVPRDPFEKFEDAAIVHKLTGTCPSV